jgi:hypothetical protein
MAVSQGTLNKAYVSAIALLDQREINPNLIDVARDSYFTDIMKVVNRYKVTKVPTYNHYVNNDVFATAVINSVSSGYGTSIMTVVLTAATGGYARVGDLVRIGNTNSTGRQAIIKTVTSVSGVDTLVLQSVDNTPLYAVATNAITFQSDAFGEKSDTPASRRYPVTRYVNQVQIFREADDITDVQKVSKIELSIGGQPYYTPLQHIYKLKALNGFISAQMIAGVQSTTLYSDANPIMVDASGNPIQTTSGLDQYITTYGISNSAATIGTMTFSDVNSIIDGFLANKAPLQQMGWMGSLARRPWDVWLKNLGSSGVNSVRLNIDGREVDLMVDKLSYGNAEFEFVHLPMFDHPQLFPYGIVPEMVGSTYFTPKDRVQVEGGGMEPRLQIRYLQSPMAGGNAVSNGIISEWHTGALAPTPTSSLMVWHTDWWTNQGLEILGAKHMQRFRVA